MTIERRLVASAALMAVALSSAALCSAQSVISAHSGTVHYFDGDVSIEGVPLQAKAGKFSEVKEREVLRTGQGRAEVLLTPGVFLRVAENSSIQMIDNRLASTRVEVVSGSAIVESDDPQMSLKNSPVTIVYGSYQVRMVKHGLVEISSEPSQIKVFKGEAEVTTASNRAIIKDGQVMPFAAGLVAEKFDTKSGDDLYLWTRDRSQSLSAANMSSARSLSESPSGSWNGGWYFNRYMDMFTYVPAYGMGASPFGYGFFSPGMIYDYYTPQYYSYGGNAFSRPITSAGLNSPVRLGGGFRGGAQLGSPVRGGSAVPGAFSGANTGGANTSGSGAASLGGNRGSFGGGAAAAGGGAAATGGASHSGIRGR
jgi:hypothetical protein